MSVARSGVQPAYVLVLLVASSADPHSLASLALPQGVEHWSLTTLREKLVKIGAKVTRHARCVTCQLAEMAVPRRLFAAILDRIAQLATPPPRTSN